MRRPPGSAHTKHNTASVVSGGRPNESSLSLLLYTAGENNAEGERAESTASTFQPHNASLFWGRKGCRREAWVMKMNNRVRGGANAERCEFHTLDDWERVSHRGCVHAPPALREQTYSRLCFSPVPLPPCVAAGPESVADCKRTMRLMILRQRQI